MTTTTVPDTLKSVLDDANPNNLADALQKVKLGSVLDVIEELITIPAGTSLVLSTASAAKKASSIVQSVDVVTGTATGVRIIGASTTTPSATVVSLSADGDTITF